jgi:hypothetical protein
VIYNDGARGLGIPRNTTNWEFYTIWNDPALKPKAKFFSNGKSFDKAAIDAVKLRGYPER